MDYIVIIIISIIFLIILNLILGNSKKRLKKIIDNKDLNKITDKMPKNVDVCRSILKMLNNNDVEIEEDKNSKNSLYIVFLNKITIGNTNNHFTRIQTIAHECLHSVQNKKMLYFNFVFSNIYVIYYFVMLLLTILDKINNYNLFISIYLLFTIIYYFVRSYLEIDAMTKAKYLAKEYIESNKLCEKEEEEKLLEKYEEINNIGIPASNFVLIQENIIKFIIYLIIVLIKIIIKT